MGFLDTKDIKTLPIRLKGLDSEEGLSTSKSGLHSSSNDNMHISAESLKKDNLGHCGSKD